VDRDDRDDRDRDTYTAADDRRSEREVARDERDRVATTNYNSEHTVVTPLAPGDPDFVEDRVITPRRY
jgi:hypothetical protein